MKAKLPWLILSLGAWLLASCAMGSPDPSSGDFNVAVQTSPLRFVVNGLPVPELTLTRGTTYTFTVNTPGHPFYITRDAAGGPGAPGEETVGVMGSRVQGGTLTFTPDASHTMQLYYQCTVHTAMGNKINISD